VSQLLEGLAHVERDGRHYLITALEKSGNVALFELREL